jgi:acetamidase/formamidase
MTIHHIELERPNLHGHFSRDLPPILTIDSGDSVIFRTLDAGWHLFDDPTSFEKGIHYEPRDPEKDDGHALCGPVFVRGAKAGMVLEVRIKDVKTGIWGFSVAGGWDSSFNRKMHMVEGKNGMTWTLDSATGIATNQFGHYLNMRPFMGVMGMPADIEGLQPTPPPRFTGGNLDCRELIAGTRLFLPIAVEGGLFSLGDGHAAQGDGEVSGVAIECPMERVEVELHLHPEMNFTLPRAYTEEGWLTFGFNEDLNLAWADAMNGMLELMMELYGLDRHTSLNLASLVVSLRITQVVNGVAGVHAVLPHGALQGIKS